MAFLAFSLLLLSLASTVFMTPTPETQATCAQLAASLPGILTYPSDPVFQKEQANYWSAACREATPACILLPTSPTDVSIAVQILRKSPPSVPWTVKSGGHDPNVGHSSLKDGIVIALGRMKGAEYVASEGVVKLKPGGPWVDAVKTLEGSNVTVASGRIGTVGIGGFLLGGGLSFLSAQVGMAADTVTEFETVLPNGTIANINAQNHNDVFTAMKGSSNQFGIVTQFTMKAIPMEKVWGGVRVYSGYETERLLRAFHDFTANPVDPKAAIILTFEKFGGSIMTILFMFYHGAKAPKGVFRQFEDIPIFIDATGTKSYAAVLGDGYNGIEMMNKIAIRTSFRTITLPNVPGDDGALQQAIMEEWKDVHDDLRSMSYGTVTATFALQSFPNFIGQNAQKSGGNAMGLKASDGGRFIVELCNLWGYKEDDRRVHAAGRDMTFRIKLKLDAVNAQKAAIEARGGKVEGYLPYFLNDAASDQDVMKSYDRYDEFAALQKSIDPDGFMKRAGGFKY